MELDVLQSLLLIAVITSTFMNARITRMRYRQVMSMYLLKLALLS